MHVARAAGREFLLDLDRIDSLRRDPVGVAEIGDLQFEREAFDHDVILVDDADREPAFLLARHYALNDRRGILCGRLIHRAEPSIGPLGSTVACCGCDGEGSPDGIPPVFTASGPRYSANRAGASGVIHQLVSIRAVG